MTDTIFAPATAPGRAAIAVVRVSGPEAGFALDRLGGARPPPRRAALRTLCDADTGETLDRALVLWLPAPESYTGEDQAELQLHGGRAVVEGVIAALQQLGLRLAEPGEFTRRAFMNGRLDLSEAEGVADLIEAETEAQRRQALAQMAGALAGRQSAWRAALLEASALLEADIDFSDEDLPGGLAAQARAPLERLRAEIAEALADMRGARIREGYRIALLGAPNAGKSSIFNVLIDRDAAIVTAIPGTTRDVIEAPLTVEGYRVLVADMAGVRETPDLVESEGVRRARSWAETADLRLIVVDRSDDGEVWRSAGDLARLGDMLVLSKTDLPSGSVAGSARAWAEGQGLDVVETVATPAGVQALRRELSKTVVQALAGTEFPAATRLRHRALLEEAHAHLGRALHAASTEPELVAENVRLAARALERLAGRIDPEAVLDRVFGDFCIGK